MTGTVVLITDFGLEDAYAAELRAAVWAAAPAVRCVDGTHLVRAGDVLSGAYACERLARAFGGGTALCAVIDPGVGSPRPLVGVECDGVLAVAPDTGILSYLWLDARRRRAVRLEVPGSASATFHGRDVLAPVAAALASGEDLARCGETLEAPRILPELVPKRDGATLRSVMVSVDHFGNCVTGIRTGDVAATIAEVRWPGGGTRRTVRTYSEIDSGLAVLWNSAGHLELAARGTSAARIAGVDVGAPVEVVLE
ncbi:MAG TPA: SAM-dependent chlorinase/fluorinase [Candidatus Binatia bacterium]|nr:SAM-dependent chlorinase/fluorinase [Candidatus Binatia bacterium]